MSENLEMKEIARLESFRAEIKGIIEKTGVADETARLIEKPMELDREEMLAWEECKRVLLAIENINKKQEGVKLTISQQSVQLGQLLADAYKLRAQSKKFIDDTQNNDKQAQKTFYAWISNKSPASPIEVAIKKIEQDGTSPTRAIKELQRTLQHNIDFYAKGGWKNQEVET